jgi:enhancing lycopene biosynthesis protein 2
MVHHPEDLQGITNTNDRFGPNTIEQEISKGVFAAAKNALLPSNLDSRRLNVNRIVVTADTLANKPGKTLDFMCIFGRMAWWLDGLNSDLHQLYC